MHTDHGAWAFTGVSLPHLRELLGTSAHITGRPGWDLFTEPMGRYHSVFLSMAFAQMLEIRAAICENWNETQCASMNDGGCSCYWNTTTCAKNTSDCSGVGITSVGDNCTLTGGEVVSDGWTGQDTGSNCCNSCTCSQGMLACTEIGCMDSCDLTISSQSRRSLAGSLALAMPLFFTRTRA